MQEVIEPSEAQIWSRTIDPEHGSLTIEAAKALLALELSAEDQGRVNQLSAKANSGLLTPAEAIQLDRYLNVGRALELLKAKARLSLCKGQ